MAKRTFKFEGVDRNRFIVAGINYTRRTLRSYSEDYEKLLHYTEINKEEVCCEGCSKGFCYQSCRECRVQQAYNDAVQELMRRACRTHNTPKERIGKTWEEMRKEVNG